MYDKERCNKNQDKKKTVKVTNHGIYTKNNIKICPLKHNKNMST